MTDTQEEPTAVGSSGRAWIWVLLRGIAAIVFGILAFVAPFAALIAIAVIFGIYALVDGVVGIVQAIRLRKEHPRWGWLLVAGVASLIAGALVLAAPVLAGAVVGIFVLWTIVLWSLVIGVLGIATAVKSGTEEKGWTIVAGVVNVIFAIALAVLVFITPGATLLGLGLMVGVYAIVHGIVLAAAAMRLRAAKL